MTEPLALQQVVKCIQGQCERSGQETTLNLPRITAHVSASVRPFCNYCGHEMMTVEMKAVNTQ